MRDRDHPPVPVATYRLQLTPDFGFDAVVAVLDHIARLGVSHLYLSPIAEVTPGSTHGYDVVDHRAVRREFGGEEGLRTLLDAAHERGLAVIVDHVPNHMAAARAELNEPWWQMLRDGPDGETARWFDVDWAAGGGKVLVPKLGEPLDDVLAAGAIEIATGDLGPELRYGPLRFPLRPGTDELPLADAVHEQHYELMWWRDPRRNVRRFFTIDDLVAVRVEDPDVARAVDTIPVMLCDHPAFAGVRVDHVDGLADPAGYLRQLRQRIGDERLLYVEKILAPGEFLPPSWPVDGTTGYEHIRITEHAVIDPAADEPLTSLWHVLTGDDRVFGDYEDAARREVLAGGLAPDLDRLVRLLETTAPPFSVRNVPPGDTNRTQNRDGGGEWRGAAVELTIGLHRYRTYFHDGRGDDDSSEQLATAAARAQASRPDLADDIDQLAQRIAADPAIATRWQQLTSPVMAKGAEDRAFYRYLRFASLCEVGGSPGVFAIADEEFHEHQRAVQQRMPLTLNAGTTHDTKRSEGVRARALALAEIADEWSAAATSWIAEHSELVDRIDPGTVLLALQTAVTAWPLSAERLADYLHKSTREADLRTSWTDPDEAYDDALTELAHLLATELVDGDDTGAAVGGEATSAGGEATSAVAPSLVSCVERTLRPGWSTALATLAIRLTAPGVPDLYQGTSAFTYSLVDPDNRAEPHWDARRALVAAAAGTDLAGAWGSGDPRAGHVITTDDVEMTDVAVADIHDSDLEVAKAVVITRLLALRRRLPDAFGRRSNYVPLVCTGDQSARLLAYGRGGLDGESDVVVLVVRRSLGAGDWSGTSLALPPGTWRDVLTDDAPVTVGGADVPVEWWLERAPVAVLERTDR